MYIGGDVVGLPVWDIRCVGEVKGHVEEIRLVEAELNGNGKALIFEEFYDVLF